MPTEKASPANHHDWKPRYLGLLLLGLGVIAMPIGLETIISLPPVSAQTSPLTIQPSTGNVGIGTTNPVGRFHVVSTGSMGTPPTLSNAYISLKDSTSGAGLYLDPNQIYADNTNINLQTNTLQPIRFWTNNIERMQITADGKVGLGTTGPTTHLEVLESGQTIAYTGYDADGINFANVVTPASQVATLNLHSTNAVTADVGGLLGFGGKYTGSTATTWAGIGGFKANATGGNYSGYLSFYTRTSGSSWTEKMRIDNSGNVGIGTTAPTSKLHVVGTFTATQKNFEIPHPLDPTKVLVHSSLEGPEVGVYYRGETQLSNGEAVVTLPAYFEALTLKDRRTVQLTPVGGWAPLYVVAGVQSGQFTVRTADKGTLSQRFYWEVKAVRADVQPIAVETAKPQAVTP